MSMVREHNWEMVIGLEVHAQITTQSKLFSRSNTEFGAEPNSQTSLIDAAFPGMLPTINRLAVRQAVKTGLAIDGKINLLSIFDRKNYFYADLPQGYQISQFTHPIVGKGQISIGDKKIGVTRIHLEQDAGKSIHDMSPQHSLIDLNRSGVALMEIVSEPDMRTSKEAGEYLKKLRAILRTLGTCDGDMEKGSLRCDANVSVRIAGTTTLGTRCEIKNLNSIRNMMRAIEYEADRQVQILEDGGQIDQETRLFDAASGTTHMMRSKEDAMDYRYFPDPDLPPLVITNEMVDEIRASIPELPDQKITRYISEYGLGKNDAEQLVIDGELCEFFEQTLVAGDNKIDPKLTMNWLTSELVGRLAKLSQSLNQSPVNPSMLAELLQLITSKQISGKIAKDVLDIMLETGESSKKIVDERAMSQVLDINVIEAAIVSVLTQHKDKVEEYRTGATKLYGFFVGQIMKATGGKANPEIINQILMKMLSTK